MTWPFCVHNRLLPAAVLFALLGVAQPCSAQDADADEQEPQRPLFVLSEMQFDQWVFGARSTPSAVRERLDSQLAARIEVLDGTADLTELQKEKLRLAGKGDIKRFLDRVDEKRNELVNKGHDPGRLNELVQGLRPFQSEFRAGLFGDESIFAKAIAKTLTPEQLAQHNRFLNDRQAYRYRSRVDWVVTTLSNGLGMTRDQRTRLTKMLLAETQPPKSYGQNEYQAALFQAAKVAEAKLRPIFDDHQWRVLARYFASVRDREPALVQGGYVADEKTEGGNAKKESGRRDP